MRKLLRYFIIAVLLGGLAFGAAAPASAKKKRSKARTTATSKKKKYKEMWKLRGTVGPYAITMTLYVSEHRFGGVGAWVTDFEGSYTYTKAGNTLRLEGNDNPFSSYYGDARPIHLEEYTKKGRNSGSWDLHDDYPRYYGTFTNNSTGEEFEVNLIRTN